MIDQVAEVFRDRRDDPDYQVAVAVQVKVSGEAALPVKPAQVLEDGGVFSTHEVMPAKESGLSTFIDGVQQWVMVGYFRTVPLLWGLTTAVAMVRVDRRMKVWGISGDEFLYAPRSRIDVSVWESRGVKIYDTDSRVRGDTSEHFRKAALRSVQMVRESTENILADQWQHSDDRGDSWLAIDGRLDIKISQAVGIVKSHRSQKFGSDDHLKVMNLPHQHRTSVFRIEGYLTSPATRSWYLRLHPRRPWEDWQRGLIRLEVEDTDEAAALAGLISGWLLQERQVVCDRDARWDRMIYPIFSCEQFGKTLSPSRVYLEAMLR